MNLHKLLIIAQVALALVTMCVRVDLTAPLVGATRSYIIVAVALNATPSHSDVSMNRVISTVNRDAPELTLANSSHYVTTFTFAGSVQQAIRIFLRIASKAFKLS